MRRLNVASKKQAIKVVTELDAFPKVLDDCQEKTASGGGISIAVFLCIFILIVSEIIYYSTTELKFEYKVDTGIDGKLKLNIDMTVAMKCHAIGADVLDVTGQDTHGFGELKYEETHFELSPNQRHYHETVQEISEFLRSEYHALQDVMWMSRGLIATYRSGMPKREIPAEGEPDACRVYGSLEVNKVAGNFHITAGKSVPVFPRGHAHISMMVHEKEYNFSHRIDHFSFGESVKGIINPLDGEEQVSSDNFHVFNYFIKIVPTEVRTYAAGNIDTYQFSVTQRNRTINHSKGSHGVPGIFVKYDLNALKIRVVEKHRPFSQFLIRLCGIVGGIFAVSGMLHNWTEFFVEVFCCKFKLGKYETKDIITNNSGGSAPASLTENASSNLPNVNLYSSPNS